MGGYEKGETFLNPLRISVFGAGLVGQVTAAGFAEAGHSVTCIEKDPKKLEAIIEGRSLPDEPDLAALIAANIAAGRLRVVSDLPHSLSSDDAIFITVETPRAMRGAVDLTAFDHLIAQAGPMFTPGQLIVIKSTVPVGTAQRARSLLNRQGQEDPHVVVVSNPEFLRAGKAISDFFAPHRVVIGCDEPQAAAGLLELIRSVIPASTPIVLTSNETAEFIKYAANSYLALRLSFINELSAYCDALGLDILDVTRAMGCDPRIGAEYLSPGPGYGGPCLPKDTDALITFGEGLGINSPLIRAIPRANRAHSNRIAETLGLLVGNALSTSRIAVLGLAFKAHSSELRGSAALAVVEELVTRGAVVTAFDPGISCATSNLKHIAVADSPEAACDDADAVLVLTEWPEFTLIDWQSCRKRMRSPIVFDVRNLLLPGDMRRAGFYYVGIGRMATAGQDHFNVKSACTNLSP